MTDLEDLGFRAARELDSIAGTALSGIVDKAALNEFELHYARNIIALSKAQLSIPKHYVYALWKSIDTFNNNARIFPKYEQDMLKAADRLRVILERTLLEQG